MFFSPPCIKGLVGNLVLFGNLYCKVSTRNNLHKFGWFFSKFLLLLGSQESWIHIWSLSLHQYLCHWSMFWKNDQCLWKNMIVFWCYDIMKFTKVLPRIKNNIIVSDEWVWPRDKGEENGKMWPSDFRFGLWYLFRIPKGDTITIK